MQSNIKQRKLIKTLLVCLVLATVLFSIVVVTRPAYAEENQGEIYYGETVHSSDGSSYVEQVETINYHHKEVIEYKINKTYPQYHIENPELKNACANLAGLNALVFYDRYCPNLIENFEPGFDRNGVYTYFMHDMQKMNEVLAILYKLMLTNIKEQGTTQTDFKNGLAQYVNGKGYNISFQSINNSGVLDMNKAEQVLRSNKPIVLYMSDYNVMKKNDSGTSVQINKKIYNGNHMMIAYGFEKIKYYDKNNNLIATKEMLFVASGTNNDLSSVYLVNNNGKMNDAEAITIY